MRLGKELINKPIYSIDEGKLLGKAQDLYLDDSLEVILGLYLGSQGLVRRRAQLIRSGDVVVFGLDAILVKNGDVITDDGELEAAKAWLRRDKLAGREVDTPGGTRLGALGDVVLDAAGRISGFALSKTYALRMAAVFMMSLSFSPGERHRSAVLDSGSADGGMTVDLARLEAALVDAPTLPPDEQEIPITVEPKE